MTYRINKTDGSILADVLDESIDVTTTDITLIGKSVPFYGEYVNENFIRLLEKFASKHAPSQPIEGQLWYDKTDKRLKVYDGIQFKTAGGALVSNTRPQKLSKGDIWIDSAENQVHFYDGEDLVLVGPIYKESQGTSGFTVADIVDANGIPRTVLKVWVGKELLGIISKDADTFTLRDPIDNYSGTVGPGFNGSNLAGLEFKVTSTSADAVYTQSGELKTAADFMLTDDNTGTIGTVSLTNATSLILGKEQNNTTYLSTDSFRIISNNTNQNYKLSTSPTSKIYVNSETRKVGVLTESPTDTLHVVGATTITGELKTSGTINSTAIDLNVKNTFIKLNSAETNAGVHSGYSTISVDRGQNTDVGIRWNEASDNWELSVADGIYSRLIALSDLAQVAFTGSYNDLINVPSGLGSDINWTEVGADIYSTTNVRMGLNAETPFASPTVPYAMEIHGIMQSSTATSKAVYMASNTVDLSLGTYFVKTVTETAALHAINVAPAGSVSMFILELQNGGSSIVKWLPFTKWQTSPPTLSSIGTDILGFFTTDAGASWQGFILGKNLTSTVTVSYWFAKLQSQFLTAIGEKNKIVVDPYDSTYVTSTETVDGTVVSYVAKFSPASSVIWKKQIYATGKNVHVTGLSITASNDIVISGYVESDGTTVGFVSLMSILGIFLWQRHLISQYSYCKVTDVKTVDTDVLILGESKAFSDTSNSLFVVKLDLASGAMKWQRSLVSEDAVVPHSASLTASSSEIFITAHSENNILLFKYSSAGLIQWQKTLYSDGSLLASSIATNATTIFICGSYTSNNQSYATIVYLNKISGVIEQEVPLTWNKHSNDPTYVAVCTDLRILSDGTLLVVGYCGSSSDIKSFVANLDGNYFIWQRYAYLNAGKLYITSMALNASSTIFVSGYSNTNNGVVAKLPPDASLYKMLMEFEVTKSTYTDSAFYNIPFSSALSEATLTTTSFAMVDSVVTEQVLDTSIYVFDNSTESAWSAIVEDNTFDWRWQETNTVAIDSVGNVYTFSYNDTAVTFDSSLVVSKFSSAGVNLWNRQFLIDFWNIGTAVCDSTGSPYIVTNNGTLIKFDSAGNILFSKTISTVIDSPRLVISGNHIVVSTYNTISSFALDGVLEWAYSVTRPVDAYNNSSVKSAVTSTGDIVMMYMTNTNIWPTNYKTNVSFCKLDAATGNIIWQTAFDIPKDITDSNTNMCLDSGDNIYVNTTLGWGGAGLLMKISNTGNLLIVRNIKLAETPGTLCSDGTDVFLTTTETFSGSEGRTYITRFTSNLEKVETTYIKQLGIYDPWAELYEMKVSGNYIYGVGYTAGIDDNGCGFIIKIPKSVSSAKSNYSNEQTVPSYTIGTEHISYSAGTMSGILGYAVGSSRSWFVTDAATTGSSVATLHTLAVNDNLDLIVSTQVDPSNQRVTKFDKCGTQLYSRRFYSSDDMFYHYAMISVAKIVEQAGEVWLIGVVDSVTTANRRTAILKLSESGISAEWGIALPIDLSHYTYSDKKEMDAYPFGDSIYIVSYDDINLISYIIRIKKSGSIDWIRQTTKKLIRCAVTTSACFVTGKDEYGAGFITKINHSGSEVWSLDLGTIDPSGIDCDSAGNVFVSANGSTTINGNIVPASFVVKISDIGAIAASKMFTAPSAVDFCNIRFSDISVNQSGEVAISGLTYSDFVSLNKLLLVKFDNNLTVIWKNELGNSRYFEFFDTEVVLKGDGICVVGTINGYSFDSAVFINYTPYFGRLLSDGSDIGRYNINGASMLYTRSAVVEHSYLMTSNPSASGIVSTTLQPQLIITQPWWQSNSFDLWNYSFNKSAAWFAIAGCPPDYNSWRDSGQFYSLAVDSQNNIYAYGYQSSYNYDNGSTAMITKFTPTGNIIWSRALSRSADLNIINDPSDVIVDSNDDIIVLGSYTSVSFKFTSAGELLWSKQLSYAETATACRVRVCSDTSIMILNAGPVTGSILEKLASDGSKIWSMVMPTHVWQESAGLFVDNDNNTYVFSTDTTYSKTILTKISSAGSILFNKLIENTISTNPEGIDIGLDGSIYLYMSDMTTYQSMIVVKLSSIGDLIWARSIDGPITSDYGAESIQIDSFNNVYLTGNIRDPARTYYGTYIVKLTSSGDMLWQKIVYPVYGEMIESIILDKQDNIIIAGWVMSGNGRTLPVVGKVPSDGTGTGTYSSEQNVQITYEDMLLITVANVTSTTIVTNTTFSSIDSNVAISDITNTASVPNYASFVHSTRYDLNNFTPYGPYEYNFWIEYYPSLYTGISGGLAITSTNDIVMTSSESLLRSLNAYLSKMSASGTVLWQKSAGSVFTSEQGMRVAVDQSGNIYLNAIGIGILKFDSNGVLLWTFESAYNAWSLYVTSSYVYTSGVESAAASTIIILKLDALIGTVVWKKTLQDYGNQMAWDITYASDTSVYMGGYLAQTGSPAFISDFVMRVDDTGTLWSRSLQNTNIGQQMWLAEHAGSLYVSGSHIDSVIYVSKFNPDMTLAWSKKIHGGVYSYGIATDTAGNSYISSYASGGALIVKLSNTGALLWMRRVSIVNSTGILVSSTASSIKCNNSMVAVVVEAGTSTLVMKLAIDGTGVGTYDVTTDTSVITVTYSIETQIAITDGNVGFVNNGLTLSDVTHTPPPSIAYSVNDSTLVTTLTNVLNVEAGPISIQTGDLSVSAIPYEFSNVVIT